MSELPRTRDSMGRFITGNPGGPGRKPREVEREYLRVLEEVNNMDVWRQICQRAVSDACNGDARARDWVSAYLLGTPVQRVMEVEQEENAITRMIHEMRVSVREEAIALESQGFQVAEKHKLYLGDNEG